MSSRKLRVLRVNVLNDTMNDESKTPVTTVAITFNRKLTALEVSGVKAVLDGEIK
jgi:hypothetical protein